MAEFTASVSESVRCFGVAPSNKWNDYAWNAFIWGEGTAQIPVFVHMEVAESEAATADVNVGSFVGISESQAQAASLEDVYVRDEQGYYHVFPDRATDGEEQDTPTWSSGTAASATWAEAASSAPVWSGS
jgi:hypothetical protein